MRVPSVLARSAVLLALAVGGAVAGMLVAGSSPAAAPAGAAATCTKAQKAKRTAALNAFRSTMQAKRRAYFRTHRGAKSRRAFVRRQQAKLVALRRAASCRVTPGGGTSTTDPTTTGGGTTETTAGTSTASTSTTTTTATTTTTTTTTTTSTTTTTTTGPSYALTVTVTGTGSGTVSSEPRGIDCRKEESPCTAHFSAGTEVTLLQVDGGGNNWFDGWGGACSGKEGCSVTMDVDKAVTATFLFT